MSDLSNKDITLFGVVRLKVKNTPEYFNKLSREAYSLFDSDSAIDMVGRFFAADSNKTKPLPSPDFFQKTQELSNKYRLTGGTILHFLEGMATFNIKDNYSIINDIVGEITLQDGIVKKIESSQYKIKVNN